MECASVAVVHQVHGDRVWAAQPDGDPLVAQADADAVYTQRPGELVAVRIADCVPILIAGPGVVAAVHAGWRGTAQGIVQRAVEQISKAARCEPMDLVAAIGPCIGPAAYEVGEEVVQSIAQRVDVARFVTRTGRRPHVDLRAANGALLEQAGVLAVDILPHCTHADKAFFSHRREGPSTGRMAAVIGLRTP
jgi:YfiH family protein